MADSRKPKKPAAYAHPTKTKEHAAETKKTGAEKPRKSHSEIQKQDSSSRRSESVKPNTSQRSEAAKKEDSSVCASGTTLRQNSQSSQRGPSSGTGARPKTYLPRAATEVDSKSIVATSSRTPSVKSDAHRPAVVDSRELDSKLRRRVESLKISPQVRSANVELAKKIVDTVIRYLKADKDFRWSTTPLNSGSYYDKTKISETDDFDYMFECEHIRCSEVNYPDVGPYCALMPSNKETDAFTSNSDGKRLLSPKLFKAHFARIIRQSMKDDDLTTYNIVVQGKSKADDGLGPAVTVKVNSTFCIDLVPVVRIYGWPKAASSWKHSNRDKTTAIKSDRIKIYAVAKIHPTEREAAADACKFWRFSFSLAEKDLIYHNDYAGQDTCKKHVICLLKEDLCELKQKHRKEDVHLSSYFMKTVVLHLLDDKIATLDWNQSNLRECYVEALCLLLKFIHDRNIPHYFMPKENLLEFTKYLVKDLKTCEQFFRLKMREYTTMPNES